MRQVESMGPLARFQDAFASSLFAPTAQAAEPVARLVAQPAFAVYRNTIMKGCIDALQANFPTVDRLVGAEWFRAAAAVFVAGELPTQPCLLAYGRKFPEFLAGFPAAAELPYLPGVARLDRLWSEAHVAADARALDHSALLGLDPEALGAATLQPHPAARWAWFAEAPVFTIWQRNREALEVGDLDWRGEGALLVRPDDEVRWIGIDAATVRFLDACAEDQPVGTAMRSALAADVNVNLILLVSNLIQAGALCGLSRKLPLTFLLELRWSLLNPASGRPGTGSPPRRPDS